MVLRQALHLQLQRFVGTQGFTSNHAWADGSAAAAVDDALGCGFDNWRVETRARTLVLQRGRGGALAVRSGPPPLLREAPSLEHNRAKPRLLGPEHPLFAALGVATADGRPKAAYASKLVQVESFLQILDAALRDALETGRLPPPSEHTPLVVADLGCGNAVLTFAAFALLRQKEIPATVAGVDAKAQAAARNTALAARLGWGADMRFVEATIASAAGFINPPPDVVLALHACDTATDDALAAAVRWRAPIALVAPCCQHALQKQLAGEEPPFPLLQRHGLLHERFGDVLTDALRAHILRLLGYRVDVVEFVGGEHSPKNLLLRAALTGAPPRAQLFEELDAVRSAFGVQPPLALLLAPELAAARAAVRGGMRAA